MVEVVEPTSGLDKASITILTDAVEHGSGLVPFESSVIAVTLEEAGLDVADVAAILVGSSATHYVPTVLEVIVRG